MFSPLFFVFVERNATKKLRPPARPKARHKGRSCQFSAPRYHPVSAHTQDAGRLSERRNGAWPFCATAVSHRPLRSELQHNCIRKPFQPVKLLSLPCMPCLLSPSLRLGVFRFITKSYVTTFRGRLQGSCAHFPQKSRSAAFFADRCTLFLRRKGSDFLRPFMSPVLKSIHPYDIINLIKRTRTVQEKPHRTEGISL